MTNPLAGRASWTSLLEREQPLVLPCAHDALSARLIERAGFSAYAIGGFALVGARYALPDIGLAGYGEMSAAIRDIMSGSSLPVMVDGDDGYGDVKNVARTIRGYEAMGAAAIFIEDQRAPKRCGHMAGKDVVDAAVMVAKIRAAVAARQDGIFLLARTDARAVHGLDEALRRGELYLEAGPTACSSRRRKRSRNWRRSAARSRACRSSPTWWKAAARPRFCRRPNCTGLGFAMVAYPTTLLFRVARTIEQALADLRAGRSSNGEGVDFSGFKDITGFAAWAAVEEQSAVKDRGSGR